MAYGARLALYRHGIRVPDDISLVGFDDQLGSAYTTPPLTTVRQPIALPTFEAKLVIRESAAMLRI
jgi:LacI family transcriptional regulator